MVTQRREQKELVFFLNGREKGTIATRLPERVFGFIEFGLTGDSARLVPDLREVRRHIKLCSDKCIDFHWLQSSYRYS